MRLIDADDEAVTIAASQRELARLAKLLEWLISEQAIMDPAAAMLESDEIYPAARAWLDFLTREALRG